MGYQFIMAAAIAEIITTPICLPAVMQSLKKWVCLSDCGHKMNISLCVDCLHSSDWLQLSPIVSGLGSGTALKWAAEIAKVVVV